MKTLNKNKSTFSVATKYRYCLCLAIFMGLMGCEAKLRLSCVSAEHDKLVVRFDEFQGIAVSETSNASVLVGSAGAVLVSQDMGASWSRSTLSRIDSETGVEANVNLIDVAACPNGSFVALDFDKRVWVSNTSITDWTEQPIQTEEDVLSVACDADNTIWIVGAFASIITSYDSGQSWSANHSLDDDYILTSIQFLEGGRAFIVGEFGKLLFSEDAGQSWQQINSLPEEFYPLAMYFSGPDTGWVSGLEGVIFHTADGGVSWSREESSTDAPIYRIVGQRDGRGSIYAAGNNGVLLERDNDGWKKLQLPKPTLSYLRAIGLLGGGSKGEAKLLVAGGSGAMQMVDVSAANR